MNPALILGGVNAALSLLEQFAPELRAAVARGEIPAEYQAVVQARIELLRSGKFFLQPHWVLAPEAQPASPLPPV